MYIEYENPTVQEAIDANPTLCEMFLHALTGAYLQGPLATGELVTCLDRYCAAMTAVLDNKPPPIGDVCPN